MPASKVEKNRRPRSAEHTKALFLQATEEVFGSHGYDGTTIRDIAKSARVNLGTLKHYWGDKPKLFRDLFETRFEPLRLQILGRLRAIERLVADGSRPGPEELLRALIETTLWVDLDLGAASTGRAKDLKQFHRLYGRALMDPSPVVIEELTRIFKEPVELFLSLLRRALPQLSAAEFDWRVNCIIGAQVFSMVYSERVGRFFGTEADVDPRQAADWMIHFMVNGIDAPPFGSHRQTRQAEAAPSPVGPKEVKTGATPRRSARVRAVSRS
jgi:AcrR family transcriptional regulator